MSGTSEGEGQGLAAAVSVHGWKSREVTVQN